MSTIHRWAIKQQNHKCQQEILYIQDKTQVNQKIHTAEKSTRTHTLIHAKQHRNTEKYTRIRIQYIQSKGQQEHVHRTAKSQSQQENIPQKCTKAIKSIRKMAKTKKSQQAYIYKTEEDTLKYR